MTNLMWFRSDLRIDDNPALAAAVARIDAPPTALFMLTPDQWRRHDWGPPRVDFVLRSLARLSTSLAERGISLLVRRADLFADTVSVLEEVVDEVGCDALFFNRELEVNEVRRDRQVQEWARERGLDVHAFEDQTVIPPGQITTGEGRPYSVFTPFKRKWLERVRSRPPEVFPPPSFPRSRKVEGEPVPDAVPGFETPRALRKLWPAGEAEATRRLGVFLEQAADRYAKDRDVPSLAGTSGLSPYLATGVLSIRRCLLEAVAANEGRLEGGSKGVQTWISELVWREFYRHVLVGFPRVSMHRPFREDTDLVRWRGEGPEFTAWCEGRTGVPFVDAGMRQLLAAGWMHNRLRMVTAMFLTKHLLVDWRLGERHFMRHLVDADLGNNNGGWQWSASTGTDAVPYFRIFNPWTQGSRYDPEGRYIQQWVPELAGLDPATIHSERRMKALDRSDLDYPLPCVDHREARERALEAFKAARSGRS